VVQPVPYTCPDCHTPVSGWVTVPTNETLLRLLKASGATTATMEEIKRDISRWCRGSVYIQVNETGRLLAHLAAAVTRFFSSNQPSFHNLRQNVTSENFGNRPSQLPVSLRCMMPQAVRDWLENAVVAAIVGGIIGGATPLLVGWWTRPKLRIDFRNDADNVVVGTTKQKDGTVTEYIWLRVRVRNVGQRIAKTCQVYLTSLYEVLPGDKTAPSPVLRDAKIVQWAGGSRSPIDIPQGIDLYADLLSVAKASGGWGMIFGLFSHQHVLDHFSGTYEFHLMVSGDNVKPNRCKIRVKCKEIGKNYEAWQVD
jgi:hypothetical protein